MLTVLAPITILLPLSALSIEFVAQISALMQKLQGAARQLDIKTLLGSAAFPVDRPRQRLAASARGHLRGPDSILV